MLQHSRMLLSVSTVLAMAAFSSTVNGQNILTALANYDEISAAATGIIRTNNVDVVTTQEGEELGFCHIPIALAFTYLVSEGQRTRFGFGMEEGLL